MRSFLALVLVLLGVASCYSPALAEDKIILFKTTLPLRVVCGDPRQVQKLMVETKQNILADLTVPTKDGATHIFLMGDENGGSWSILRRVDSLNATCIVASGEAHFLDK